jgi:hypothetical protein
VRDVEIVEPPHSALLRRLRKFVATLHRPAVP